MMMASNHGVFSSSSSSHSSPSSSSSSSSSPSSSYAKSLISHPVAEPTSVTSTIGALGLQKHIEGGYFVETDRDRQLKIPNPFLLHHDDDDDDVDVVSDLTTPTSPQERPSLTRDASTSIFYLLSPGSPVGHFHRNKGRTIHTLHRGRGRYVIVHADRVSQPRLQPGSSDEPGAIKAPAPAVPAAATAPIESFVVGHDLAKGEKLQWVVEGGKYKASYLLPDKDSNDSNDDDDDDDDENRASQAGLLISETVVPGFEYADHDFMTVDALRALVLPHQFHQLAWLLRKGDPRKVEEFS